jgi:hypothetical protein
MPTEGKDIVAEMQTVFKAAALNSLEVQSTVGRSLAIFDREFVFPGHGLGAVAVKCASYLFLFIQP